MSGLYQKAAAVILAVGLSGPAGAGTFATPQEAVDALFTAVQAGDAEAVIAVFGEEARDLLSESPEEQAANRDVFLELAGAGYRLEPLDDGGMEILLGAIEWPFAIPLIETDGQWKFDIEAGREELLAREIGLNELEVIALMDAYGDLQAAFRLQDHNGDGVMEFASSVISSAEARDGLFWPGDGSFIGERLARAAAVGFSDGVETYAPEPHFGYVFRVLQGQGDNAPGGAMPYMVNGNMVSGHALLAVPAAYGESGIHSFMVSENGVILEADLGPETAEITDGMMLYDPSPDWRVAE